MKINEGLKFANPNINVVSILYREMVIEKNVKNC